MNPPSGIRSRRSADHAEGRSLAIVGVAGNVRQSGLDSGADPESFCPPPAARWLHGHPGPHRRRSRSAAAGGARTRGRARSQSAHPAARFHGAGAGRGLERRRFSALLLALFAALAMLLAAIGIYGMLNYWVTSREPEIAVRLALGATPTRILGWTGAHALRLAGRGGHRWGDGRVGGCATAEGPGLRDSRRTIRPRSPGRRWRF